MTRPPCDLDQLAGDGARRAIIGRPAQFVEVNAPALCPNISIIHQRGNLDFGQDTVGIVIYPLNTCLTSPESASPSQSPPNECVAETLTIGVPVASRCLRACQIHTAQLRVNLGDCEVAL